MTRESGAGGAGCPAGQPLVGELASQDQPVRIEAVKRPSRNVVIVSSRQLFAGAREVRIKHRGECYRLLETKNGKLVMNK